MFIFVILKNDFMKIKTLAQTLHEQNFTNSTLRGGPLEIRGGGGENLKKNLCKEKCLDRAAITSEKKNLCKQTAKYKYS